MYLWLKQGAEEQLQFFKEQGLVGDLRVETDRTSGKKYINTYTEVSDPTSEIAEALGDLTEKVTAKDHIVCGLRADGVYRHNGATLTVKTGMYYQDSREVWQLVSVSGPSVEAVNTIYSLFRQGKLAPEENWENDATIAPPVSAPAVEIKEGTA